MPCVQVEWQDLKDYFKSAGEVTYADVFKLPDGRSRGCGIVEFASPADATNAIETLNDTDFKGRLLYVREDNKEDGAAVAGGGGGGGGGNRVRVGNVRLWRRVFLVVCLFAFVRLCAACLAV